MLEAVLVLLGQGGQVEQVDAPDGVEVVGFLRVFKADLRARLIPLEHLVQRQGPGVVEALELGAADLPQELHLVLPLHALADGVQAQADGHLHQLRQDDLALFLVVKLLHEAHVELDQVHLQALQHVQRGIAAAEVVHPHGEAQAAETLHLGFYEVEVAAHDALGDLDGDQAAGEPGGVHPGADLFDDVAGVEVRPGEVDGLGHQEQALRLLERQLFQHLLHHVKVQPVDQLGLLQDGDEIRRGEEAALRVDPPGQGFLVADPPVGGADDGLVVDLDPALGDGPVQVADDVLLLFGHGQHGVVVVLEGGFVGGADGVAGDLGQVAGGADVHVPGFVQVDARQDGGTSLAALGVPVLEQLVQLVLQARLLGDDGEVILPKSAAALLAEGGGEQLGQGPEQLVAAGEAVALVVELHAAEVQVQAGEAAAALFGAGQVPVGQLEEIGHAGQAGEQVVVVAVQDALLEPGLQLVPILLLLVFQHEGVEQAGAQHAADGVQRQQRIEGLGGDEARHGQAEQRDGAVAQAHGALPAHRHGQGVGRRHQEHEDLDRQGDVAGRPRLVGAAFEGVQHGQEEVGDDDDDLKGEQQPAHGEQQPPEQVLVLQVFHHIAGPEQYGQGHGGKIEGGVRVGQGDQPAVVERAPEDIGDVIDGDGEQKGTIGAMGRDDLFVGALPEHIVIDDQMDEQGQKPRAGIEHASPSYPERVFKTLMRLKRHLPGFRNTL